MLIYSMSVSVDGLVTARAGGDRVDDPQRGAVSFGLA